MAASIIIGAVLIVASFVIAEIFVQRKFNKKNKK